MNNDIQVAAAYDYGIKRQYAEKNTEYEVTISGNITLIRSNVLYNEEDMGKNYYEKILEISQWGETGLTNIYLGNCTKLRKIAGPSENSFINITNFIQTFLNCESLTEIPEDLFSNCPNVDSFQSAFENCIGLTSLPQNLFSNCQQVTDSG